MQFEYITAKHATLSPPPLLLLLLPMKCNLGESAATALPKSLRCTLATIYNDKDATARSPAPHLLLIKCNNREKNISAAKAIPKSLRCNSATLCNDKDATARSPPPSRKNATAEGKSESDTEQPYYYFG